MSQPNRQPWRKLRSHGGRASDVDQLLNALRVLDRIVVEISMHIYKIPRRDRAAMLEQHRCLHDTIRERLPRFL
ncbi:MAG TPA: hypothetical protein VEI52_02935 [Terriglobales bacterium]|nr:hypothetical protein [Terriglobales bacterium]